MSGQLRAVCVQSPYSLKSRGGSHLSLFWAVQADKADFKKDDLGTSLIPDIDRKPAGHPVALKSSANGDCVYNSVSL